MRGDRCDSICITQMVDGRDLPSVLFKRVERATLQNEFGTVF